MIDYNMHSHFCRHAVGGVAEYTRAACRKGIREICFTPHIPLPGFRPGFLNDRLRMDERELDAYRVELEETRAAFPELTILSGVEADSIAWNGGLAPAVPLPARLRLRAHVRSLCLRLA